MNKIIKQAIKIDEFSNNLPMVGIGDVVRLGDIWDGRGVAPDTSYSYPLTDMDTINYVFNIAEKNEELLESLIRIIDIELL